MEMQIWYWTKIGMQRKMGECEEVLIQSRNLLRYYYIRLHHLRMIIHFVIWQCNVVLTTPYYKAV